MFGRMKTAMKYFMIGLGVGLLTAPRTGQQTREMIVDRAESLIGIAEEKLERGKEMVTRGSQTGVTRPGSRPEEPSLSPTLGPSEPLPPMP